MKKLFLLIIIALFFSGNIAFGQVQNANSPKPLKAAVKSVTPKPTTQNKSGITVKKNIKVAPKSAIKTKLNPKPAPRPKLVPKKTIPKPKAAPKTGK